MKKSEVLTLLQAIQYPGFSRDIVSFGMVKNVDVSKDTVAIELTIKTQNDEKKKIVVDEIKNILSQYFKQVDIKIIDDGPHQGHRRNHHSLQFNRNLIWIILKM